MSYIMTRKRRISKKHGGDKAGKDNAKAKANKTQRRTTLNHLTQARKAIHEQKRWSNKFPLLDNYQTAPDGLIYFDYDEKQFSKWVPLEPLSDMDEFDCVAASCVALRVHKHEDSRKTSRSCNRRKKGIFYVTVV